jgi:hypothetical protein
MTDRLQNIVIPNLIFELEKAGIKGFREYETRLRNNAGNNDVFSDLLFEANVALMFVHNGFQVTIREKPDVKIELNGEKVYVEVKHFRKKEQDVIDEKAMKESDDLIPVGILTPTEGNEPWEQIANVAMRKIHQYKENAPNILVIETGSNAISGIELQTAVNIFDERASGDIRLQKLNALMLIDQWVDISKNKNVYFCQTTFVENPMSSSMIDKLASIQNWNTPWGVLKIQYL